MADIVSVGRARTIPAEHAAVQRRPYSLAVLGALAYLFLAGTMGGALVVVAAPDLRAPVLLPAVGLAVAAYVAERTSYRARDALRKNVALAVYVVAALLLPAPWAVLIAASAIVACHLTRRGVPPADRLAAIAHTTLVAALITVLAHVVVGDVGLVAALMALLAGLDHLLPTTAEAPIDATHLPRLATLISLALGAYLLDTLPLVFLGALIRRTDPLRVWRDLYSRTLFAELAVPGLGILGALAGTVTWSAAVLTLPFVVVLYWGLEQGRARHAGPGAMPTDRPAQGLLQEPAAAVLERLSAVLAAVRALGDNEDLAQVAHTLACAAPRLTCFRACAVYLYESHSGLFVPYAGTATDHKAASRAPIPRDRAERLMSYQNRLGYSYYARVAREPGAPDEEWRAGDVLLVPLLLKNGDVIGLIALDGPVDSRVPQADDLAPLETVASLGARVMARLRHTDEALRLAATDGLTGLLNRRAFEERLRRELEANGYRRPVALMMLDLDDFGAINNSHGHQIGDEALRIVSDVIRAHLRQSDAGSRYGGDEFVVILPGLDAAAAVDIAERVRAALVEATARAAAQGKMPRMNTSIGVASFPRDAADPDALIKAADDALYLSKRLGKNCVSLRSVT